MPSRRIFLQLSLAAGLGASLGLPLGLARAEEPGRWFMPDEGEPQQRAFIAFGAQDAIWEDFTADVQAALGRIAQAIARYQPVTVFCRPSERELAEQHCASQRTSFVECELDDIWMRDIGANFVVDDDGALAAVDFNFNGWGNKQRHSNDAQLARRVTTLAGARYQRSDLVGEGGAI